MSILNDVVTKTTQSAALAIADEVLEAVAWSDRLEVDREALCIYAEGENDAGKPVAGAIELRANDDGSVTVVLIARNGTRVQISGVPKLGIS
jgi:predicted phosphoribosyltransferase